MRAFEVGDRVEVTNIGHTRAWERGCVVEELAGLCAVLFDDGYMESGFFPDELKCITIVDAIAELDE